MTNSNNTNVRLNLTLPALERLIGENPEIKLELSQQVCETHIMNGVFASMKETMENNGFYDLVERWDKTLESL